MKKLSFTLIILILLAASSLNGQYGNKQAGLRTGYRGGIFYQVTSEAGNAEIGYQAMLGFSNNGIQLTGLRIVYETSLNEISPDLYFPVLFGAGGISYVSKESNMNNNLIEDSEAFLLIEPAAEIELNLTRFFRFAIGASYRYPTSFDVGLSGTPSASAASIKGMSYTATFKFGKF